MSTTVELAPAIEQDGTLVAPDEWAVHCEILEIQARIKQDYLDLAENLLTFQEMKGWRALGHPTWESYLADPDVDLSRSRANKIVRVMKLYVLMYHIERELLIEAGYNKLDLMAPHMHSGNVDEWVNKAAALSRSDLRIALREEFGDDATPPLPTDYRTRYIMARRKLRQRYWKHWEFERER